MHFDDRLETVLRMRANGAVMQRIQFRQLLDLLGVLPAAANGPQIDLAYGRLAELSGQVPESDRVATLADPALRLRSARLVAALASGEARVADMALRRAQLSGEQWLDLVPALPPAARPALRERSDLAPEVLELLARLGINSRGLPPAPSPGEPAEAQSAPAPDAPPQAADTAATPPEPETPAEPVIALVSSTDIPERPAPPPREQERRHSFPIFNVSEIEDIAVSLTEAEPDNLADAPSAVAEAELARLLPELAPDAPHEEDEPAITLKASEIEDLALALTDVEPIDLGQTPVNYYEAEYHHFPPELVPSEDVDHAGAAPVETAADAIGLPPALDDPAEPLELAADQIAAAPDPAQGEDAFSSAPSATADLPAVSAQVLPPEPPIQAEPIGAIVKRIEAFRQSRQIVDHAATGDSPRLPLGEDILAARGPTLRSIDFAVNAQGRVNWCDASLMPMMMGLMLREGEAIERLFRQRLSIRAQIIALRGAPAISGDWQIDAQPWFDSLTGAFQGYRGRLRRAAGADHPAPAKPANDSESDRIRQMLHELRTPVNAIQGFAEILQQQLFGPTPHEYRALAASIASDAARMLSAFEELERIARLDSRAMELDEGACDFAEVVEAVVAQLCAHTKPRGSGFELAMESRPLMVGLARIELERMAWRLLTTLGGIAAPNEWLALALGTRAGMIELEAALPASLAAREGEAIFRAGANAIPQVIASGVFGVGFALRLARAEARASGGDLVRRGENLILTLPVLTASGDNHTQNLGTFAVESA